MEKHLLELDLQRFAETDEQADTKPEQDNDQAEQQQETPTAKTFTQEELNAIIDKRLERERRDAQARIDKAVTEAQKLAKMNAEERAEHERKALEKALAEREAEITKRELRAEAKSQLIDKGLPVELAEVLPYTDADSTSTALEAVERVFRAAVDKGVTERLRGNAPKVSQGGTAKISAEDVEKMSYSERVRLFQTDKDSYDKYFGGK